MPTRKIARHPSITIQMTVLPETSLGDGGEVTLLKPPGREIGVALPTRLFRILQILIDAYFEDERIGVAPHLRGVRNVTAILKAYARQVHEVAKMRPSSLRKYMREIRAAFEPALCEAAKDVDSPGTDLAQAVIKTVGRHGYQLGLASFVYIDHSEPPPIAPAPPSTMPSTPAPA